LSCFGGRLPSARPQGSCGGTAPAAAARAGCVLAETATPPFATAAGLRRRCLLREAPCRLSGRAPRTPRTHARTRVGDAASGGQAASRGQAASLVPICATNRGQADAASASEASHVLALWSETGLRRPHASARANHATWWKSHSRPWCFGHLPRSKSDDRSGPCSRRRAAARYPSWRRQAGHWGPARVANPAGCSSRHGQGLRGGPGAGDVGGAAGLVRGWSKRMMKSGRGDR